MSEGSRTVGALDFLRPQVAVACLKVPPETLAELILHPYASKAVSNIYQCAFLGTWNVTDEHPAHSLKGAGGGNPEKNNLRAFCYKCHPLAHGGMKSLAQETEATLNSIDAILARSDTPAEGRMEKVTHSFDELEDRYCILSCRRAVTELHHPLHMRGKAIGCERCGTMPYQGAIFLFARRYWNCLDYEWVRIALNKWRKEEETSLTHRFFEDYRQVPCIPAVAIRALKVWQRVETIRRENGRTLQGAFRNAASFLNLDPRTVENAYYDGLRFLDEFVTRICAGTVENWREKMEKAQPGVILKSEQ